VEGGRASKYVRYGSKADICGAKRDVCFTPESGHSIAADLMAMRAAAFELQQADELARSFAKSNTKRLIRSTDLSRSPDTSRSSP
jgi:hypothetical protein